MPNDDFATLIAKYPPENRRVRSSAAIAIGFHVFVAVLVCVITWWLGITSLKDLLTHGGAIAESGPAPETPMSVELVVEDTPPPPTPNPVFEIVKPKVVPPPPTPPKKEEPKPKVVAKVKPRYTAPNAHGEGKTQNLSAARVGSSGLPAPPYPYAAKNANEEGTVGMEVAFGPDGAVANAEVVQSSGVSLLDVSTRNFVYGHWKNALLANQTIHVPVIYDLSQPTAH